MFIVGQDKGKQLHLISLFLVGQYEGRKCIFITSISDPEEPPTRDVTSQSKSGVAYLTENLIKRLTKEENISQVTSLHVTLGKDLNKKIKVHI